MQVYPLVTWLVPVPAFTIDVEMNGITEALSVPDGAYFGWLTTGADGGGGLRSPGTGSIGLLIQDVLNTHSESFGCSARYGISSATLIGGITPDGTAVGIYLQDLPGDTAITATSDVDALRLLGLEVGDVLGFECIIARRTAGIWRPGSTEGAVLEPVYTAIGSGAWSPYDASARDRILLSGALAWAATWTYVEAADISQRLLAIGNYGPLASRAPGDTAGTLDDLLYAAARNGALTLALTPSPETAAIDYQECILAASGDLMRDAYTTPVSIGSRRYTVTLPLRSTTSYVPS